MPPFPDAKASSRLTSASIPGGLAAPRSDNALGNGEALDLPSSGDLPAWGMWGFSSGQATLLSLNVDLDVPSGSEVYLLLADYSAGRWEVHGPFAGDAQIPLDAARHRSPNGGVWAAAITCGGDLCTVVGLTLGMDTGWRVVTVRTGANFRGTALALVDGKPAIAFTDASNAVLGYAHSSSVDGANAADWDTVDIGVVVSESTELAVVDGKPAIVYIDGDVGSVVRFAHSSTVNGASLSDWSSVPVHSTTAAVYDPSLAVCGGKPAISFIDQATSKLSYARSSTAGGASAGDWTTVELADVVDYASWDSLAEVDGRPAIAYYNDTEDVLQYLLSSTPEGLAPTDWNAIHVYDSGIGTGIDPCLTLIGGKPAIAFLSTPDSSDDMSWQSIAYAHSSTLDGADVSDWSVVSFDSGYESAFFTGLAEIAGKPAMILSNFFGGPLRYLGSTTVSGADPADWVPDYPDPQPNTGEQCSLANINGAPAVAYLADGAIPELRYAVYLP